MATEARPIRHYLWAPWEGVGLDYVRVRPEIGGGFDFDGVLVGIADGVPFRIHYGVSCDDRWQTREVDIGAIEDERPLLFGSEEHGRWERVGRHLPEFDGCLDVDIAGTPATNTLAIRRLGLRPGESREIDVVYVSVPDLRLSRARQRYTCLERRADGGLYRFESLESGFTADLPVDSDGLVLDYPGLFRRVWPCP